MLFSFSYLWLLFLSLSLFLGCRPRTHCTTHIFSLYAMFVDKIFLLFFFIQNVLFIVLLSYTCIHKKKLLLSLRVSGFCTIIDIFYYWKFCAFFDFGYVRDFELYVYCVIVRVMYIEKKRKETWLLLMKPYVKTKLINKFNKYRNFHWEHWSLQLF